jgi:uncharacterized protein YndB with AHSA1/START domain
MSKPNFVYVTYIASTPERIWEALTSAEFTERYMFGRRVESTWAVGAPVRYWGREGTVSDSGEVLEADPPRRLVISWRVEFDDALRREGYSKVTFELEPLGGEVKLTVIHDELRAGSGVEQGISMGWPKALSSLKSLLETGRPLAVSSPESAAAGEAAAIETANAHGPR